MAETTPILDDNRIKQIVEEAFNAPDSMDDPETIIETAVKACKTIRNQLAADWYQQQAGQDGPAPVIGGTND